MRISGLAGNGRAPSGGAVAIPWLCAESGRLDYGFPMSGLTTHVLDTMHGRPAAGVALRLLKAGEEVAQAVTNADGRCDGPLLGGEALKAGAYRLEFDVGAYYRAAGVDLARPAFLETVAVEFSIAEAGTHYHVPLLVSPYGYSTYRGS
jgi:5-hydroxyisourate hydrolase